MLAEKTRTDQLYWGKVINQWFNYVKRPTVLHGRPGIYFISLHTNSYTNSSVNGLEVYTATDKGAGYELGYNILSSLVQSTGLRNRGMKDGAELRVLKNAQMPATLVEMGYISNEGDAILLRDNPELFAQGLYNGICSYFDALEMTE